MIMENNLFTTFKQEMTYAHVIKGVEGVTATDHEKLEMCQLARTLIKHNVEDTAYIFCSIVKAVMVK